MRTIGCVFFLSILCGVSFAGIRPEEELFDVQDHTGFVVLSNGDTLQGNIRFENNYKNYRTLRFTNLQNHRTRYKPEEVRMFSFDSLTFRSAKRGKTAVFERLLVNDSLKVTLYRFFLSNSYYSLTETSYAFEKSGGERLVFYLNRISWFRKRAQAFFSDCPELSQKIASRVYKTKDYVQIATEYNAWLRREEAQESFSGETAADEKEEGMPALNNEQGDETMMEE